MILTKPIPLDQLLIAIKKMLMTGSASDMLDWNPGMVLRQGSEAVLVSRTDWDPLFPGVWFHWLVCCTVSAGTMDLSLRDGAKEGKVALKGSWGLLCGGRWDRLDLFSRKRMTWFSEFQLWVRLDPWSASCSVTLANVTSFLSIPKWS